MIITKSLFLDYKKCPHLFFKNAQESREYVDKEKISFKEEISKFFFGDVKVAKHESISLNILDLKREKALKNFSVFHKNLKANVHILKKESDGYELVEILPKSNIKGHIYDILAFKYLLLAKNNITPKRCFIIKILNNYKKDNEDTLFETTELLEVTEKVKKHLHYVKKEVEEISKIKKEPQKMMETFCFRPYECIRHKQCWGETPINSVLTLIGMPIGKKLELLKSGKTDIEEIKDSLLTPEQLKQKSSLKKPFIDLKKIKEFIECLGDELYFLDFESHQPILPVYETMGSFEPVVFQYSIHKLKGDELTHYEYLGDVSQENTREKIAQDLLKILPKDKRVVVYGAHFERAILKRLGNSFPDYKNGIDAILKNIVDLNTPFKNLFCYFPIMRGKHSLKAVLPAFSKDLYKELDVANGQQLVDEYKEFLYSNEETKKEIKKKLLAYCKTDTLALVYIYKNLTTLCSDMFDSNSTN